MTAICCTQATPLRHDRRLSYFIVDGNYDITTNLFTLDRSGNSTLVMRRGVDINETPNRQGVYVRSFFLSFICNHAEWPIELVTAVCLKTFSHTRYRALGPYLIPVYRQSARRWLFKSSSAVGCHYFPPGLRSPSQLKSVTVQYQVILFDDRVSYRCDQLAQGCYAALSRWKLNSGPIDRKSNALPLRHNGMNALRNTSYRY